MRGVRALAAAGIALSLLAVGTEAMAGEATVTDPRSDTAMGRGGPDIVSARIGYGKRIVATLGYASSPETSGTISGANLEFKNGRSYTLQRHAADPAWGTPLTNSILVGSTCVPCAGVKSSVNRTSRTVTVSAPSSCFKGKSAKLRAQGFSFTVNFDSDETGWTKQVAKEPTKKGKQKNQKGKKGKKGNKGKKGKQKVSHKIIRLGESSITAVQTDDTSSGGVVKNTNAVANFSGLRCVADKCKAATVKVSASLKLQRRVNGSWSTVMTLPAAGKDTVVAPTMTRTFPDAAAIRYVWSGRATLGQETARFTKTSAALTVQ